MTASRILTIDPGSMLGWATDATGRLEWGTESFKIRNGESSGNRWLRFGRWLDDVTRKFHDPEDSEVYTLRVDLIVYEKSHFPSSARYAADVAAGFTTRLEEHCERHGIALQPVAVQTLKAFAIPKVKRKKGDPKMDRSKAAMISAARNKLGSLGDDRGPGRCGPGGFETYPLTEHEADALWAYWWAKENCG